MYPPVEAPSGQDWYSDRSGWPELRCTPSLQASGGQDWYLGLIDLSSDIPPNQRHQVAKTSTKLGLLDLSSDVPFSDFSIAFLISGDKGSSTKVVPCCSNTSQGEPVGVLGPWTGAQCGQAPYPPATKYLTNPKPDRLIFCHMAGWLANCSLHTGWLTAYQTKCQLTLPRQRHLVAMCVTALVT